MKYTLLLHTFLVLLFTCTSAKTLENDFADHTGLATLMLYNSQYDKAKKELQKVRKDSFSYDAAKYYTVYGVLYSKLGESKKAIEAFLKAVEATKKKSFAPKERKTKTEFLFALGKDAQEANNKQNNIKKAQKIKKEKIAKLYMYMAKEYYKLKDFENTVLALQNAGELATDRAELYTLKAECYHKLKRDAQALKTLQEGIEKFHDAPQLLKQKFYYLAELGLYQRAIEVAKEYIEHSGDAPKEYLALAQLLIKAKQNDNAVMVLESALMRYPKNPQIKILLAHLYLQAGMKHSSAHILDEASYLNKKYINDAVEVNKRAGNISHALYLNSQNLNKKQKIKQKIAIYLESGEFRKIIGLQKALKRYKMLDDENLRYTLAYAYYMVGDYEKAEEQLKYITDNELFTKATVIRKNIQKCNNNPMECIQ